MQNNLFSTKVRVEKSETTLSKDNLWETRYVPWKEVWACVQLKNIGVKQSLYLFTVRWKGDFPKNFRIKINNAIFTPTQPIAVDMRNNLIIFHAKQKQEEI